MELREITGKKEELAQLITPLIQEKLEKIRGRYEYREEKLSSPLGVVEALIRDMASPGAQDANQPGAPRSEWKTRKKWLTRASNNARDFRKGQMDIRTRISHLINICLNNGE